ncbi:MAG TPA: hypothetical protein PKD80_11295 [Microthrixaceae bacterium]|jgi:DNA-binding response OmpR family regulator|nr:hypothetical protein [Microthrixaceae bacterium]HMT24360.1 hypothetical protein [Microthrixaceae bacterium]HMT62123.1 hypothetical protein [Microthrixaceae bacterium]
MGRNRERRTWTWKSGSPRVLLECAPHDSPDIIAEVIRREGYEVAVCTGPDQSHPCDLLEHGSCALVGDADVVVNLLGSQTGNEIGRQVAAARRPPPLVLEVRPRYEAELDGMPDGRSVKITKRVSRSNLLASIREALRRSSQGPPMWGDGSP